MATGLIKRTTIIGVEKETTEGTYLEPQAATSFIQPLSDGFDLKPKEDIIKRSILTNSIGLPTPRLGMRSVTSDLPVEFRASGIEGGDVDFAALLEGALGTKRSITSNVTTKSSGNTGSSLKIQDADIGKFNFGDIFIVKEAGAHWPCAITAVDATSGAAAITVTPPRASGSFPNSVVLSKSQMYFTANSNHPPLSVSMYWANAILQKAIGCKVSGMSIDGFETGGTASIKFTLEGLDFDEAAGSAGYTPVFDSGIPPLILKACVFRDGVDMSLNSFGLQLQNTLSFLTSTCAAAGKISSRVTERAITGTIDPYKDDTSTAFFDAFKAGTEFSIFTAAYIPSAVAGEIEMGSLVGIYLPKCIVTDIGVTDKNDVLIDQQSFQAVRGANGDTEEMFMGFI